jgi:nicotinamidase-related amidase
MVGAATNWCIRATAYAVLDREFDLTLVEDAHTAESFEISPTLKIDAKPVIDDLNVDI